MPDRPHTVITESHISDLLDKPQTVRLNQMVFSLLKGKSLQEIIDFGYKMLGNPPLLVSEATLVASPPNCGFANSTFLDMIHGTAPECHEPLYILTGDEFIKKQQSSDTPLLVDCRHLGLRLIIAKIVCDGERVAVLQVPESEKNFGDKDILFVHILAQFISAELSREDSDSNLSDMLFRAKFLTLLQRNENKDMNWVHVLKETDSTKLCVAVLQLPEAEKGNYSSIEKEVHNSLYFCKGVIYDGELVFLCTLKSRANYSELKEQLSMTARDCGAAVGLSARFSDSTRILAHYKQAKRTLDAGQNIHGDGCLYDYNQFSIEAVLFDAAHHFKTEKYYEYAYSIISEADCKKETELLETLAEYIKQGCDKNQTCLSLGIHRNTLSFRLHCIEMLLGRKISEGEGMYALRFMEQLRRISIFHDAEDK